MEVFSVPPRIAFSDPISGSSLLVSHTTSLGSVAGPVAPAGAGTALASSVAPEGAPRKNAAAASRSVTERLVRVIARNLSFVFREPLRIEGFAHGFADEHNEDQRDR